MDTRYFALVLYPFVLRIGPLLMFGEVWRLLIVGERRRRYLWFSRGQRHRICAFYRKRAGR